MKDEIWYVGPFLEEVEDLVADLDEPGREEEFREDIATRTSGYVY